jgi:hypothetical protein
VHSITSVYINRSVLSGRTNDSFIPATGLASCGLAGGMAVVPWQATSPLFQSPFGVPFGPSVFGVAAWPGWSCAFRPCSASIALRALHLLCRLQTPPRYSALISQRPASMPRSTGEASRGKTRYLHCIDAGFTKCTPTADGGLRGHVPARPGCITPHIRFLFIAPQFRIGLPSDPASRRRPCPSPCLRLCENLAIGLAPMK